MRSHLPSKRGGKRTGPDPRLHQQNSLLSGNVTRLTCEIPVRHGPATAAELGAMLEHACGNLRYVRNLAAAKPENRIDREAYLSIKRHRKATRKRFALDAIVASLMMSSALLSVFLLLLVQIG